MNKLLTTLLLGLMVNSVNAADILSASDSETLQLEVPQVAHMTIKDGSTVLSQEDRRYADFTIDSIRDGSVSLDPLFKVEIESNDKFDLEISSAKGKMTDDAQIAGGDTDFADARFHIPYEVKMEMLDNHQGSGISSDLAIGAKMNSVYSDASSMMSGSAKNIVSLETNGVTGSQNTLDASAESATAGLVAPVEMGVFIQKAPAGVIDQLASGVYTDTITFTFTAQL
jgi:hypothetical protein